MKPPTAVPDDTIGRNLERGSPISPCSYFHLDRSLSWSPENFNLFQNGFYWSFFLFKGQYCNNLQIYTKRQRKTPLSENLVIRSISSWSLHSARVWAWVWAWAHTCVRLCVIRWAAVVRIRVVGLAVFCLLWHQNSCLAGDKEWGRGGTYLPVHWKGFHPPRHSDPESRHGNPEDRRQGAGGSWTAWTEKEQPLWWQEAGKPRLVPFRQHSLL